MNAAEKSHFEVMQVLVDAGADVNLQNEVRLSKWNFESTCNIT